MDFSSNMQYYIFMTAPQKVKFRVFFVCLLVWFVFLKHIPHLQIVTRNAFISATASTVTLLGLADIST